MGPYHFAEVLHEVAHLERWRWLGESPDRADEHAVCQLALEIARQYGFADSTCSFLRDELAHTPEG